MKTKPVGALKRGVDRLVAGGEQAQVEAGGLARGDLGPGLLVDEQLGLVAGGLGDDEGDGQGVGVVLEVEVAVALDFQGCLVDAARGVVEGADAEDAVQGGSSGRISMPVKVWVRRPPTASGPSNAGQGRSGLSMKQAHVRLHLPTGARRSGSVVATPVAVGRRRRRHFGAAPGAPNRSP
ncbi:hypothetical protein [Streptomyces venetus]|uniref:hypothetical protein n=1 Tax=Streptomyces venetus TaxID=1701086 RepID=UPI0031EC366C